MNEVPGGTSTLTLGTLSASGLQWMVGVGSNEGRGGRGEVLFEKLLGNVEEYGRDLLTAGAGAVFSELTSEERENLLILSVNVL